jgi:hypothetical protein
MRIILLYFFLVSLSNHSANCIDFTVSLKGEVLVVGSDTAIYQFDFTTFKWVKLPGRNFFKVAISSDGIIWAIKTDFTLYKYISNTWTQLAGVCAKDISANSFVAILTCTQTNNYGLPMAVYSTISSSFVTTNGLGNFISTGPNNNLWYINSAGEIFFSPDQGTSLDSYCATVSNVSKIYITNTNTALISIGQTIYKFNPTTLTFGNLICTSSIFDASPFFWDETYSKLLSCIFSGIMTF